MLAYMGASWFQDLLACASAMFQWRPWNDGFNILNQVTTLIKHAFSASPATKRKRKARRERRSLTSMLFCALNLGTTAPTVNPASETFAYETKPPYGNGAFICSRREWRNMEEAAGIFVTRHPPWKRTPADLEKLHPKLRAPPDRHDLPASFYRRHPFPSETRRSQANYSFTIPSQDGGADLLSKLEVP